MEMSAGTLWACRPLQAAAKPHDCPLWAFKAVLAASRQSDCPVRAEQFSRAAHNLRDSPWLAAFKQDQAAVDRAVKLIGIRKDKSESRWLVLLTRHFHAAQHVGRKCKR